MAACTTPYLATSKIWNGMMEWNNGMEWNDDGMLMSSLFHCYVESFCFIPVSFQHHSIIIPFHILEVAFLGFILKNRLTTLAHMHMLMCLP